MLQNIIDFLGVQGPVWFVSAVLWCLFTVWLAFQIFRDNITLFGVAWLGSFSSFMTLLAVLGHFNNLNDHFSQTIVIGCIGGYSAIVAEYIRKRKRRSAIDG